MKSSPTITVSRRPRSSPTSREARRIAGRDGGSTPAQLVWRWPRQLGVRPRPVREPAGKRGRERETPAGGGIPLEKDLCGHVKWDPHSWVVVVIATWPDGAERREATSR